MTAAIRWPTELALAEAAVTGPDPYRDGWVACMEWEALDPPPSLSPEDADTWRRGWEDAYDAPLGSACP